MDIKDRFILSNLYVSLLSENQCEMLFRVIKEAEAVYIPGLMPYGTSFYYTNENMLDVEIYDEIKNLEIDNPITMPILIRHIARYILKNNSGMEGGVPA
jgi:hypothetical protein